MPEAKTNLSHELYLAIDQGGHASRVMVFDVQGNVVTQATREVKVFHPCPECVEQDGDEIELSIKDALNEVIHVLGDDSNAIVAVGLATQRSNVVCWNRDTGKTLSPVLSWQDRRAYQWIHQFEIHSRRIYQITGLLPSAHYGVSKLKWCLDNLSEVRDCHENGTLAWGPLSSFLLYRLLDEHPILVDPANASRTLLWSIDLRDWSDELLTLFGLGIENLPVCVPNRYHYGNLDLGQFKIPLTVSTGDQSAALFAFGKPENSIANINIGTGAFLQTVIDGIKYKKTFEHDGEFDAKVSGCLLKSVVWSESEHSMIVLEATVNGAGSALLLVEDELDIAPEQAEEFLPGWLLSTENIPLYLNGVSGLGSPFWAPSFESRFVGDGERAEKMVAVIESIVFLLQVNLEAMRTKGIVLTQIIVSGGLSVLDGLCQRLADLSHLPVRRPVQCESTAKGLAYLVAENKEAWQSGKSTFFNPASNKELSQRYQRWQEELENALNVEKEGAGS